MTPIVIVPGLGGSGETHWQTHLQRSLPNATRVQQDDWERPELTRWTERLARTVETRPGAILVAHSLGCPLVAHLARQRPDLSSKGRCWSLPPTLIQRITHRAKPAALPDSAPSASVSQYPRREHQRPLHHDRTRARAGHRLGCRLRQCRGGWPYQRRGRLRSLARGRGYGQFPDSLGGRAVGKVHE